MLVSLLRVKHSKKLDIRFTSPKLDDCNLLRFLTEAAESDKKLQSMTESIKDVDSF